MGKQEYLAKSLEGRGLEAHPLLLEQETLQHILAEILEIMDEYEPHEWLFFILIYLSVEVEQELKSRKDSEQVKTFLTSYIGKIKDIVREEITQTEKKFIQEPQGLQNLSAEESKKMHAEHALEIIHKIAALFDEEFPIQTVEQFEFQIDKISIDDLVNQFSQENSYGGYKMNMMKKEVALEQSADSVTIHILQIYSPEQNKWFDFPLPTHSQIWHKGGFPRILLKLHVNAPISTIEAELPPNDFDVLAQIDASLSSEEVLKHAQYMGVDAEGIEHIHTYDEDFIFRTRDLSLNTCIISNDTLIFTEEAKKSAETGGLTQVAEERGLYGSDALFYQGEKLAKSRGMFRLIKFVCEKKALSFEFKPLNQQIDLGIYWLVLVRKFLLKENASELFAHLFDIAKQMGQVKEGERDIFDALDRVHEQNPFFNFDESQLDEKGIAQWLTKKLINYSLRVFKKAYKVPSEMNLERKEGDTITYEVKLSDHIDFIEDFEQKWKNFLSRCRERNRKYNDDLQTLAAA